MVHRAFGAPHEVRTGTIVDVDAVSASACASWLDLLNSSKRTGSGSSVAVWVANRVEWVNARSSRGTEAGFAGLARRVEGSLGPWISRLKVPVFVVTLLVDLVTVVFARSVSLSAREVWVRAIARRGLTLSSPIGTCARVFIPESVASAAEVLTRP